MIAAIPAWSLGHRALSFAELRRNLTWHPSKSDAAGSGLLSKHVFQQQTAAEKDTPWIWVCEGQPCIPEAEASYLETLTWTFSLFSGALLLREIHSWLWGQKLRGVFQTMWIWSINILLDLALNIFRCTKDTECSWSYFDVCPLKMIPLPHSLGCCSQMFVLCHCKHGCGWRTPPGPSPGAQRPERWWSPFIGAEFKKKKSFKKHPLQM